MRALANRVIDCCRTLATFTEEPGKITRTFLSPPMRDVHAYLSSWMRELGMRVWVDNAGNIHGSAGGKRGRVIVGSHLDTVPDAGAFDGILGVVLAIALVEDSRRARIEHSVEVIGFSEEEGVRFGLPFIGSRAVMGTLGDVDPRIGAAILDFGLDPAAVNEARLAPGAAAYLEIHIEQGPALEALGLPLGIVESIAGQSRLDFVFSGRANHAGTTPMSLRADALAATAEWILEVERIADAGLVATVGRLQVEPNATNVIPGFVRASLDVRHRCDHVRLAAVASLASRASEIGTRRGVEVTFQTRLDQPAVPMDADLTALLADAVREAGHPVHLMDSGAGHDAMIVAPHLPSTMLFLRSPGGVSHHPSETVLPADVEAALESGLQFLKTMAARNV